MRPSGSQGRTITIRNGKTGKSIGAQLTTMRQPGTSQPKIKVKAMRNGQMRPGK